MDDNAPGVLDAPEVRAFLKRAKTDRRFACAIESVVGGTPTGVLEEDDLDLVEQFIAVHGLDRLKAAADRFVESLPTDAEPEPLGAKPSRKLKGAR
jgi:hypothetical protein